MVRVLKHRSSAYPASLTTLVDLLHWRATQQHEERLYTFLEDGDTREQHLTYGELDRQARAIGATLQGLRASGERVLLLYPAGLEYISAFFGSLYAGAIPVPVYPPHMNRSLDRLRAIAHDSQATVALTSAALLPHIQRCASEGQGLQGLRLLVTGNELEGIESAWQAPQLDQDSIAFLQYTSGSTGLPKGVMLSHGNLLYNQRMIQKAFQHTEQSRIVGWLPLYHDMGLIGNILQPLYVGCRCVLMSPMAFLQRPVRWLQAISRYQATTSGGPNFAYDLCVRKVTPEQRAKLDLSSWDLAFNGAEPVRQETLERFASTFAPAGFRREALYPCYGLAEATLLVSGGVKHAAPVVQTVRRTALENHRVIPTSPQHADAQTLVSCGQTLLAQQVRIVDPQSHTPCAMGQVGEIWISGPSVAQGYWQRPADTAHTFQAQLAGQPGETFVRTGDLGFVHHGQLFVTGRLKDIIIIRGSNHYPQDIELTVERSHAALRPGCGAAFAVEIDGEERLVVAHEVQRAVKPRRTTGVEEPSDDIASILGNVRQVIAEEHGLQPHAVLLLQAGSLPKTSSGKVQRHACRSAFLTQTLSIVGAWPTASPQPPTVYTLPTLQERREKQMVQAAQTANIIQPELCHVVPHAA